MNELRVVHCVGEYLPVTENWTYQLIKHQVGIEKYVASGHFMEGPFYLDDTRYLRRPKILIGTQETSHYFVNRLFNAVYRKLRQGYSSYAAEELKDVKVDIVHSHFATVGWHYQNLATRLGALHFVSFYGMDYEHIVQTMPKWKARYESLFQSADSFICEGSHGAATLKKLGCPEFKISVAKLGVDVALIPFHSRVKNANELKLLQVASFREKKGHADCITAFAGALHQFPNMSLTLIGNGDLKLRERMQHLVTQLGILDRVRFLPGIDLEILHETMKDHHVFIQPSRHTSDKDSEGGAPIVLLDAQATGMPIISTLHCDIPDEVLHGKTGLLCGESETLQISDAIGVFYKMPQDSYSVFSANARKHVENTYDIRTNANEIVELYRGLRAKKKSRN